MRPTHIDRVMADEGCVPAQVAARACGVHLSTIYRAVTSGHIEGKRCGRHWYVVAASVADYYRLPGLSDALSHGLEETRKGGVHETAPVEHLD